MCGQGLARGGRAAKSVREAVKSGWTTGGGGLSLPLEHGNFGVFFAREQASSTWIARFHSIERAKSGSFGGKRGSRSAWLLFDADSIELPSTRKVTT